jgi:hypothetical protein
LRAAARTHLRRFSAPRLPPDQSPNHLPDPSPDGRRGATVPDASTPWPADQLDARLLQLTADRRDWFAQLGFRLEPEANPEAYYFRVLLDDAKWEALINEALAADAYYRQRDAS